MLYTVKGEAWRGKGRSQVHTLEGAPFPHPPPHHTHPWTEERVSNQPSGGSSHLLSTKSIRGGHTRTMASSLALGSGTISRARKQSALMRVLILKGSRPSPERTEASGPSVRGGHPGPGCVWTGRSLTHCRIPVLWERNPSPEETVIFMNALKFL